MNIASSKRELPHICMRLCKPKSISSVLAHFCMYHYFHVQNSYMYFPSPTHSNKTSSEYKTERALHSIAVSPPGLIIMIDQSKTSHFQGILFPFHYPGHTQCKESSFASFNCSNIRCKSFFYYWWRWSKPHFILFYFFRNAPHGPPNGSLYRVCKARYSLALTMSGYQKIASQSGSMRLEKKRMKTSCIFCKLLVI